MRRHRPIRSRLAVLAGLVVASFGIALALVVGNRLSDEALAVLAGAVCGVGAAIPTSLLVVAVSRRRDEPHARPAPPNPYQGAYPPVVVIAPPGAAQQGANAWNGLPSSFDAPIQRQFTVVGGSPPEADRMVYGP
jgi:drug/metabolite transporter (DMT)-like permease